MGTPPAAGVSSSRWALGKNYNQLVPSQPTDSAAGKVEVVEVFWYGCGHCYHFDPYLENWRKKGRPAFVDFRRVPVMWNDINRQHARLFYVLQALGKLVQALPVQRKAKPLEVISVLHWDDDDDTMVVTLFDPNFKDNRQPVFLRTYWQREAGQWKLVFEGPP